MGTEDNLPISLALMRGIVATAAKLWDKLNVKNVILIAIPPMLSYECDGDYCEQLMWEVHEGLEESGYTAILEKKGNRYTFHIYRKISL